MFAKVYVPPGAYGEDDFHIGCLIHIFLTPSQFGIDELKTLALNFIKSKIGAENVLTELSSSLTLRYAGYRTMHGSAS